MAATSAASAVLALAGAASSANAHSQGWYTTHCGYSNATRAICSVWGKLKYTALRVAGCESSYSVVAANGEYFGLFQMGKHERQLFGGSTKNVWDQARAGYRYYLYEIRNGFYGLDPWISSERCWG